MNRLNEGGPAFPITSAEFRNGHWHGLSMRDYFAAAALTGMLADSRREGGDVEYVHYAYKYADAMLAQRGVKS